MACLLPTPKLKKALMDLQGSRAFFDVVEYLKAQSERADSAAINAESSADVARGRARGYREILGALKVK